MASGGCTGYSHQHGPLWKHSLWKSVWPSIVTQAKVINSTPSCYRTTDIYMNLQFQRGLEQWAIHTKVGSTDLRDLSRGPTRKWTILHLGYPVLAQHQGYPMAGQHVRRLSRRQAPGCGSPPWAYSAMTGPPHPSLTRGVFLFKGQVRQLGWWWWAAHPSSDLHSWRSVPFLIKQEGFSVTQAAPEN